MTKIMDTEQVKRAVTRIAHEICEKNKGVSDLCIVGIRTRGAFLAQRIVREIRNIEQVDVPLGILDITLYRDDLSLISEQPVVHETKIDFDIADRKVILMDDVLYTGRT
ncbi:MAG: bifunctional pyr operon transcriptional regulator/uracil phosphoribosyltransferase, partial [Candidatus Omnitrophica bacterium]|nr:bifunctional pyr operon transcriptional regulator/uracil phosphoribosyltransferase [Candidatus Omnitrophota bacterium]